MTTLSIYCKTALARQYVDSYSCFERARSHARVARHVALWRTGQWDESYKRHVSDALLWRRIAKELRAVGL